MRWVQHHSLRYVQIPALADLPGVWHGISARFEIQRDGRRIPFNLGLNGSDPDRRVWDNRRRFVAAAGGGRPAIFARQTHGDDVGVWDQAQQQRLKEDHAWLKGDALITDVPGATLVIQTADCQSVVLFDPVQRVVGNIHSGWRGSIRNIIGRTVETMAARYDCRPQNLICGIGPSLGPCCAEFIHYRREIPEPLWRYRREGDLFDFWRLSVDQLVEAGVPPEQISVGGICTRCNQHLFYSYRGEGQAAGRFAAAIRLMPV